jgi:hypothetical protein
MIPHDPRRQRAAREDLSAAAAGQQLVDTRFISVRIVRGAVPEFRWRREGVAGENAATPVAQL